MRKMIVIILLLTCMLGLMGCSDKKMRFDIGDADKLTIESEITGEEVIITDIEVISAITKDINSLRFERTSATHTNLIHAYILTWFDASDKEIAKVSITEENGYQISHEGYFYKVGADHCIDTEFIKEAIRTASAP